MRLPDLEVGDEELQERGESDVEVLRGDGVERVDDIDGELERGEAEVDARRDDAVEHLEGARGFLAAEALLEVEEVPMRRNWKELMVMCTWLMMGGSSGRAR